MNKNFSERLRKCFASLDLRIPGWKFSWITTKNWNGDKLFSLVCIPNDKSQNIKVFVGFAKYKVGYSQGTNRSERGYYLVTPTGGASNGSGKSSPSTPTEYDLSYDIDHLKSYLNNDSSSGYFVDVVKPKYDSMLREFPSNTKVSEIKNYVR